MDVATLLGALGVEARKSGAEWRGYCPEPKHRKKIGSSAQTKQGPGTWQINPETFLHHCYACGFGGGLLDLVSAALEVDRSEARRWVAVHVRRELPTGVSVSNHRKPRVQRKVLPYPKESEPLWSKDLSASGSRAREYVLSRGVLPEEVERWRICATPVDGPEYAGRVIVPIVVRGEMVDFVARLYVERGPSVSKALSGRKDRGARKELALWGYDDLSPTQERVHLVEGIWGAVALLRAGIGNVVASCGSAWSWERTKLLSSWNDFVVIPDGDSAGRKFGEQVRSSLRFVGVVTVVSLRDGTQPDDYSVGDICRMLGGGTS